jgi:hypothetical protein
MHESADRQFVWIIVFIKYLAGDMTEVPSIKMSGGSGESGQNACDRRSQSYAFARTTERAIASPAFHFVFTDIISPAPPEKEGICPRARKGRRRVGGDFPRWGKSPCFDPTCPDRHTN